MVKQYEINMEVGPAQRVLGSEKLVDRRVQLRWAGNETVIIARAFETAPEPDEEWARQVIELMTKPQHDEPICEDFWCNRR